MQKQMLQAELQWQLRNEWLQRVMNGQQTQQSMK
jgi:hypothetical protein